MDIKAVEIREYWAAIKPAIEGIMQAMPWQDFFIEDVFAQCQNGQSVLFVDRDVPRGASWFIAKVKQNDVGESILFLWLVYSQSASTIAESHKAVEEIARSAGCVAIETLMHSPELAEHAAQFGYDQKMFLVRKTLRSE